ncbi:MAG: 2-C-methyl-D-erythritol 2,4-cyclodiphosphate synthase [Betaproteobacteria bacterium]|nr:2-C-methyl-D-erythritol 2,4-cyclodiphosphate synthase [Betaproteobacteria bacterium]
MTDFLRTPLRADAAQNAGAAQEAHGLLQSWRARAVRSAAHSSPSLSQSSALWGVLPAAGAGLRAGLGLPKQYWRGGGPGPTMLERSTLALAAIARIDAFAGILVVVSPEDSHWEAEGLGAALRAVLGNDFPLMACAIGGASRRDSVLAALTLLHTALGPEADRDWVMVHDAARPELSSDALMRLWSALHKSESGGLLALPVPDTVKRQSSVGEDDPIDRPGEHRQAGRDLVPGNNAVVPKVAQTLSREGLWLAQTPQMFRLAPLTNALRAMPTATDESSAIENLGVCPILVEGDWANRKFTYEKDFTGFSDMTTPALPTAWPRIGQGFDVHALVEGRRLVLGGVEIPYEKGLLGHSDADALLHAICDALLGAAGLGDIGRHFPDSAAAYKDADSRVLLRDVVAKLKGLGLAPQQIDATIIAQAPKMAPHIAQMVANIQADCGCSRVNVKATTTEWLGFTGRGEGIACQAVAMVVPAS